MAIFLFFLAVSGFDRQQYQLMVMDLWTNWMNSLIWVVRFFIGCPQLYLTLLCWLDFVKCLVSTHGYVSLHCCLLSPLAHCMDLPIKNSWYCANQICIVPKFSNLEIQSIIDLVLCLSFQSWKLRKIISCQQPSYCGVPLVQVHAFMLCTCVPLSHPFDMHVAKPTQMGTPLYRLQIEQEVNQVGFHCLYVCFTYWWRSGVKFLPLPLCSWHPNSLSSPSKLIPLCNLSSHSLMSGHPVLNGAAPTSPL